MYVKIFISKLILCITNYGNNAKGCLTVTGPSAAIFRTPEIKKGQIVIIMQKTNCLTCKEKYSFLCHILVYIYDLIHVINIITSNLVF